MSGYSCLSQAGVGPGKEWVIMEGEEKERKKSLENMKQLLVRFDKKESASLKAIKPTPLSSGHSAAESST